MPKPKKSAPKKATPKKPAAKPKAKKKSHVHTMKIVCDKHTDCLKFARDVAKAAKKLPGKHGHKLRDLAEGFVPG